MSNLGNTFQADILKLILNGTPISLLADNAASTPATNLTAALHTADPGGTGTQSTSELSYTGYVRQDVLRNASTPAWTVTGANPASASPNSPVTFPISTGGTGGIANYASLGDGSGKILVKGLLNPPITVSAGVTPVIGVTTAIKLS